MANIQQSPYSPTRRETPEGVVRVHNHNFGVCELRSRLEQRVAGAELLYHNAVYNMKQLRGTGFERAWRLSEFRRSSLQIARQALLDHEREHLCDGARAQASLQIGV